MALVLVLGLVVLFRGPVLASPFQPFTQAGTEETAAFDLVLWSEGGRGLAAQVAADSSGVDFFGTVEGGEGWSDTPQGRWEIKPEPNLARTGLGVHLHPQLISVWPTFRDERTGLAKGALFVSQDGGRSWAELTPTLRRALGGLELVVLDAQGSGVDLTVLAEAAGEENQLLFKLLPLRNGWRVSQVWETGLTKCRMAVLADGLTMGYGHDHQDRAFVFRLDPAAEELTLTPAAEIHPDLDPSWIRANAAGQGVTLVNFRHRASTFQGLAVFSADGRGWRTIYQTETSAAEEPGFEFWDVLGLDSQTALLSLISWETDPESDLDRSSAFKIKLTTDGGATWSTLAEGPAGNQVYGFRRDLDGLIRVYAAQNRAPWRTVGSWVIQID